MGLKKEFVEERIIPLQHVPSSWGYDVVGNNYILDLRMAFIRELQFDFKWGDEKNPVVRAMPITEQPSRILKIDISLNDLFSIEGYTLDPFRQLRSLNASINRIVSFGGVSVCRKLKQLDLSFNFVISLLDLQFCNELIELKVNHNHLSSLETMPRLHLLTTLSVDGNKLTSLNGIQKLMALQELTARKNRITDIGAVAACRNLIQLDLMDNHIDALEKTSEILKTLPKLQDLSLLRNPICSYPSYRKTMESLLTLKTLDGVSLAAEDRPAGNSKNLENPNSDIEIFRDVAKKAYMERIRQSRLNTQEDVRHLQKRIIAMLDDQDYLEKKLLNEMEATMSHIDFLDRQTLENFRDMHLLRGREDFFQPHQYRKSKLKQEKYHADRNGQGDTDELLRLTAIKLSNEIHHQSTVTKKNHPMSRTPVYEPEYFH